MSLKADSYGIANAPDIFRSFATFVSKGLVKRLYIAPCTANWPASLENALAKAVPHSSK